MTSIRLNVQKLLGFRLKNTGPKAGGKPVVAAGVKAGTKPSRPG